MIEREGDIEMAVKRRVGKCLELQTETKQKLVIRNSLITKRVVIVCCKSPRPGSQRKERIQESSMSKHTIMMASSLSSPHPTGEYSNIVKENGRVTKGMKSLSS